MPNCWRPAVITTAYIPRKYLQVAATASTNNENSAVGKENVTQSRCLTAGGGSAERSQGGAAGKTLEKAAKTLILIEGVLF